MNRSSLVFVGAVLALAWGLPAMAQSGEAAPDAVLEAWASSFNECSAEKLAALYDPGATLWGTNSGSLITNPEGIRFYFTGACAMQPPVKVSIGEHETRVFGTSAASAGAYTFDRDGKAIPARFSFAMIRVNDRWLIVQHHSSRLPGRP